MPRRSLALWGYKASIDYELMYLLANLAALMPGERRQMKFMFTIIDYGVSLQLVSSDITLASIGLRDSSRSDINAVMK